MTQRNSGVDRPQEGFTKSKKKLRRLGSNMAGVPNQKGWLKKYAQGKGGRKRKGKNLGVEGS